uniref:Fibronectin type-II domain-containing protein n=1 Tax=Varanus komodoensis TaxID=61221 RepID=A0A8D2J1B9_VARKO
MTIFHLLNSVLFYFMLLSFHSFSYSACFSEHRPCTFPFIFENNAYFACTREGAGDNALWCATTDDYDRDTKWKVCALEEYGGSSNGKPCIFPFIYRNETYYNCTTENSENGLFWCATTANYNQDKEWSYCPDENYNLRKPALKPDFSACVFPFIYNNKTYSTCTKDGSEVGWLWCATTNSYDRDHKWKRCYEKGKSIFSKTRKTERDGPALKDKSWVQ